MIVEVKNFKNGIIYLFVNCILIFTAYCLRSNMNNITIVAIIQLFLSLYLMYITNKEIVQVGIVFLCISFLFNFGQSLITLFWENDRYSAYNAYNRVSESTYIMAEFYVLICTMFLVFGYIVFSKNSIIRSIDNDNDDEDEWELLRIRKIAVAVFIVSFIPMLVIDIMKIRLLLSSGYVSTHQVNLVGIGKYLDIIAQFCKPALAVIVFTYKKNIKIATRITIAASIYLLLMMLSGDRGSNLIYLLSIMIVYFIFIRKMKLKNLLVLAIMAYMLLSVLTAISIFRDYDFTVENFIKAYNWRKGDGVIYSSLHEFGDSIASLAYAIEYIPNFSMYRFGSTYLVAPITILPKIPNFINEILLSSYTFTKLFPQSVQYAIGGSYLGELYSNFGWLGPLVITFVGICISKIDNILRTSRSVRHVSICIVLLPFLILWIRDYFSVLFSVTFWFMILIKFVRVPLSKDIKQIMSEK